MGRRTRQEILEAGGKEGGTQRGNTSSQSTNNQYGVGGQTKGQGQAEGINVQQNNEKLVVDKPRDVKLNIPETGNINEASIQPKKQRRSNKNKNNDGVVSAQDLSLLISGVFSLVALKGGEHWRVTPGEADAIAKPLESILQKADLLEKVSNISDGAMLVFAVSSVTIPRIIITQQLAEQQRKNKIKVIQGGKANGAGTEARKEQTINNVSSGENTPRIEETKSIVAKSYNPVLETEAN